MQPNVRDAGLKATCTLPAGATVTTSTALDIGPVTTQGNYCPSIESEFLLECPALTTTELPDAKTITYDIITSANADLSSPSIVKKACITQTGAGGVGAAAATTRFRPTTGALRYLGFQATGIALVAASDASASMTYVS